MAVGFTSDEFTDRIHPGVTSTVEHWGALWADELHRRHAGRAWDSAKALPIARERVIASGITSDRGARLDALVRLFEVAAARRWAELTAVSESRGGTPRTGR
jgi:hypothetical protein